MKKIIISCLLSFLVNQCMSMGPKKTKPEETKKVTFQDKLVAQFLNPLRFNKQGEFKPMPWLSNEMQIKIAQELMHSSVFAWLAQNTSITSQEISGDMYPETYNAHGARFLSIDDCAVKMWGAATGDCLRIFRHDDWVLSARFNKEGDRVLTASCDSTAKLWNVATGSCLMCFEHKKGVNSARFSREGNRVLTASYGNTARLWDVETGSCLRVFRHNGPVESAWFSREGDRVLTASGGTVRLFDVETGECLRCFKHNGPVNSARFSKEGNRLLTASWDCTARLWDVVTGICLRVFRHDDLVGSARFSKEGSGVVAKILNGTVRVWNIEPINSIEKSIQDLRIEQALLIYLVYEIALVNRCNKERNNSEKYFFDFKALPHLEPVYNSLSTEVKSVLSQYCQERKKYTE